ncbi:hypothetical protein GCM10010401_02690 [Rarobacter faecitabidus]
MGKVERHFDTDDPYLFAAGAHKSDLGYANPVVDTRLADGDLLTSVWSASATKKASVAYETKAYHTTRKGRRKCATSL